MAHWPGAPPIVLRLLGLVHQGNKTLIKVASGVWTVHDRTEIPFVVVGAPGPCRVCSSLRAAEFYPDSHRMWLCQAVLPPRMGLCRAPLERGGALTPRALNLRLAPRRLSCLNYPGDGGWWGYTRRGRNGHGRWMRRWRHEMSPHGHDEPPTSPSEVILHDLWGLNSGCDQLTTTKVSMFLRSRYSSLSRTQYCPCRVGPPPRRISETLVAHQSQRRSRGSGRTPLDWDARMRSALSAARGLAHLHTANLVHGNVKASNVLLRPDADAAALSDFSLHQLFAPSSTRAGGYRAPEVVDSRRLTFKSDVYSLGVLLLELLTGKSPSHASLEGDSTLDLPRWVQSVVREEWTAEVFDVELVRLGASAEEEMVALLQVAMACVATVPDARPDAPDVVRMIEEIGAGHGGRTTTEESEGMRGTSEEEPSRSGGTPPTAPTPQTRGFPWLCLVSIGSKCPTIAPPHTGRPVHLKPDESDRTWRNLGVIHSTYGASRIKPSRRGARPSPDQGFFYRTRRPNRRPADRLADRWLGKNADRFGRLAGLVA
ncbi:hypothetical protein HU200_047588 [Digitaria exilis]|uniref:Protein kinase domain-containing protein n=1 Tax=Digitaria exilis TaxID=1010633 RepID=A0A835E8R6_9POAL|nr:hypothetical protein HU200_047588 [Digitaria exilis]